MSSSFELIIAVLESQPRWGPELQRQFLRLPVDVRECRSIDDLFPLTAQYRAGIFVIDLDIFAEVWVTKVCSSELGGSNNWPVIGIGSPTLNKFEWMLRDAGLSELLPGSIIGDDLRKVCQRYLA